MLLPLFYKIISPCFRVLLLLQRKSFITSENDLTSEFSNGTFVSDIRGTFIPTLSNKLELKGDSMRQKKEIIIFAPSKAEPMIMVPFAAIRTVPIAALA